MVGRYNRVHPIGCTAYDALFSLELSDLRVGHTWLSVPPKLVMASVLSVYPAYSTTQCSEWVPRLLALQHDPNPDYQLKERTIFVHGKYHVQPRLVSVVGRAGTKYYYSGVTNHGTGLPEIVAEIISSVSAQTGQDYNVAIINWYRDGRDHIGWHSDNHRDLVPGSHIASVSLGQARTFQVKPKVKGTGPINITLQGQTQDIPPYKYSGERLDIELGHGSLVTMDGAFQQEYQHCVPKRLRLAPNSWRLNVTLRLVK